MHDPGAAALDRRSGFYVAICYRTWRGVLAEHHHCKEPRRHAVDGAPHICQCAARDLTTERDRRAAIFAESIEADRVKARAG
jgi:hypothetical protein